ncbi:MULTISPECIES: MarR family winged helix-turn-helix transcriptional regulator [unclassified Rathayibacter]|uniref:MarR family winged helix-turn-helix transcriptional regulator n=1 Tax=unclassified Rathayibacter TaxID=2609250 RepID=UPI0006F4AED7|nr:MULTISPECIES: MarR family transcriptional regulator [unclassified Rathayibacter]KQQ00041.1 MarR family transcriptional regulator [Rathayibacter sp. Leaf294]KQS09495.1 MarR family transcriptional regulator [Rathayibacter sp. Leaf185]
MDDHRPLTGADLETWSALATVLEWLPPALDADLVRDVELTHFEYGILYALAAAPDGALRMSTLADFANSSLSRLSRAVSRLESRGRARRSPDPTDGRSTLAVLTDDGRDLLERATPTHERAVRALVLDPLTATQRRQLGEIALRIQRAVREREGWRP